MIFWEFSVSSSHYRECNGNYATGLRMFISYMWKCWRNIGCANQRPQRMFYLTTRSHPIERWFIRLVASRRSNTSVYVCSAVNKDDDDDDNNVQRSNREIAKQYSVSTRRETRQATVFQIFYRVYKFYPGFTKWHNERLTYKITAKKIGIILHLISTKSPSLSNRYNSDTIWNWN